MWLALIGLFDGFKIGASRDIIRLKAKLNLFIIEI